MRNTLDEIQQFLVKEFKGVDPGRIVISIKGSWTEEEVPFYDLGGYRYMGTVYECHVKGDPIEYGFSRKYVLEDIEGIRWLTEREAIIEDCSLYSKQLKNSIKKAYWLGEQGEHQEALKIYYELLEERPNEIFLCQLLVREYELMGDTSFTLKQLDKEGLSSLAFVLADKGMQSLSTSMLRKELCDRFENALDDANMYLREKNYRNAIETICQHLSVMGEDFLNLQRLYCKQGAIADENEADILNLYRAQTSALLSAHHRAVILSNPVVGKDLIVPDKVMIGQEEYDVHCDDNWNGLLLDSEFWSSHPKVDRIVFEGEFDFDHDLGTSFKLSGAKEFVVPDNHPYLLADDGILYMRITEESKNLTLYQTNSECCGNEGLMLVTVPPKHHNKDLIIREDCTIIRSSAFAGCDLNSITIPSSVQYICAATFVDFKLKKIYVPNKWCKIDDMHNDMPDVEIASSEQLSLFDSAALNKDIENYWKKCLSGTCTYDDMRANPEWNEWYRLNESGTIDEERSADSTPF